MALVNTKKDVGLITNKAGSTTDPNVSVMVIGLILVALAALKVGTGLFSEKFWVASAEIVLPLPATSMTDPAGNCTLRTVNACVCGVASNV